MMAPIRTLLALSVLALTGCVTTVTPAHSDFTQLRTEAPHSILIVPAINSSMAVNAPDYYLATITIPLAERGYYVFPVNMVKSVLADDGLSDANLVHAADPHRLGELFGADAVLYVSIDHWDAKYVVLSTTVSACKPAVKSEAEKACMPRSPALKVYAAGSTARLSLLAKETVPV